MSSGNTPQKIQVNPSAENKGQLLEWIQAIPPHEKIQVNPSAEF